MSAARRRRKANERRYAWKCARCFQTLRTPDDIRARVCPSCVIGAVRPEVYREFREVAR